MVIETLRNALRKMRKKKPSTFASKWFFQTNSIFINQIFCVVHRFCLTMLLLNSNSGTAK